MKPYKMIELGTLIHQAKTVRCGKEDYPILSMTMHDGLVFQDDKFKKVIASKDRSDYKVVYRNQLVISFPIDEGVLAAQRIVNAGIVSPAYGIWNIDQDKILPEFLEYALRSKRALNYYKAKLRGSTARRRSLPTPTLLSFSVPLPDIQEQEYILEVIHKAKSIVNNRELELNMLDELVKARFVEMFGDPMASDNRWQKSTVGEQFDVTSGGTPATAEKLYWENGAIPWIGSNMCQDTILYESDGKCITEEGYAHSSAKWFYSGTVLVALVGATIGKTALLRFNTTTNQNIAAIDVNGNSAFASEFVFYHLQLQYNKFMEIGSGKFKMANQGFIRQLPIICPPVFMQQHFATFVAEIEKSKDVVQRALDEAQTLFNSLMQKYFG